MGFARQGDSGQYLATMRLDMTAQVRERATHTDEIIHQHIIGSGKNRSVELGLPCEPGETIRAGVPNHVNLYHARIDRPPQPFAQLVSKNLGYGIDPFALKRVGADQYRLVSLQHPAKRFHLLRVQRVPNQMHCGHCIATLSRPVGRVLFDGGFAGVNQHIGEIMPVGSRRFHGLKLYHALVMAPWVIQ